jgi:hypothetical protein
MDVAVGAVDRRAVEPTVLLKARPFVRAQDLKNRLNIRITYR